MLLGSEAEHLQLSSSTSQLPVRTPPDCERMCGCRAAALLCSAGGADKRAEWLDKQVVTREVPGLRSLRSRLLRWSAGSARPQASPLFPEEVHGNEACCCYDVGCLSLIALLTVQCVGGGGWGAWGGCKCQGRSPLDCPVGMLNLGFKWECKSVLFNACLKGEFRTAFQIQMSLCGSHDFSLMCLPVCV